MKKEIAVASIMQIINKVDNDGREGYIQGIVDEMYLPFESQEPDIFPLTIVRDRYNGSYSKAKYTAWNLSCEDVPSYINEGDMEAMDFWNSNEIDVGLGDTIRTAVLHLQVILAKKNASN